MFHLHLFRTTEEEKIDIYYRQMTPMLQKVISIVKSEKPVISGTFDDEKILLEPEDIYYFDTVDRKTFAYTYDKVCQISKSLTALEEELSPFGFVRINKANLVNIFMIKKIKPEANMRVLAILKNEESLIINRGYKRSFEDYLKTVRKSI